MIFNFSKTNDNNEEMYDNEIIIGEYYYAINEGEVGRIENAGIKIIVAKERISGETVTGQGDHYFKVYDINERKNLHMRPCSRISIYKPVYIKHGTLYMLNKNQRTALVNFFKQDPNNWVTLLNAINECIPYGCPLVPTNLPIPDYDKLDVSARGLKTSS